MKKLICIFFTIILSSQVYSQSGSITNVNVAQRSDGSGLVDVYFILSGPAGSYFMNLRVSFDAGLNYFPITSNSMTGDVGPTSPGSNKHIVWNPTIDHPNRYSPQTKLRIIAYHQEGMNPCPGAPTVIDYDGNAYNTVLIGNQCWMASNLNTTRTASGNTITRYCYNNNSEYCEQYGGLYTWAVAMNGAASSNNNPSGVQGICPNGWHLPGDAEWTQLTDYLINNYNDITAVNVGNKLKSCRQVSSPLGNECNTSDHPRWEYYTVTIYGTNDFGFSALPGGYYYGGSYGTVGSYGNWWSSTEYSSSTAWYRSMYYNYGGVYRSHDNMSYGFSVRCLRD